MTVSTCLTDTPASQRPSQRTPRFSPRTLVMPRGDTALDRAFRTRTAPDVDLGHPDHPRRWMRVAHAQWRGSRRQLRDAIATLRRYRANARQDPTDGRVDIALLDLRAAYWADRAATARLADAIAAFEAADAHLVLSIIPRTPRPATRRQVPVRRTDPPRTGPKAGAVRQAGGDRLGLPSHWRRRRDAGSRQRGLPATPPDSSGAPEIDAQLVRRRQ